jgi:ribonuclease J
MLRIVPLGGLGEIGLNCMAFEHSGERMLVDCGLMFPRGNMPGVEIIVPDFTWLSDDPEALKGIVLTHAHEDHIGALPFLLKRISVPVWGTRFTLGLARHKLEEAGVRADLREISPRERFRVSDAFIVEAVRVSHSVPDGVALIITSPSGTVVHTGDFKLDGTPIDGRPTDLERLGEVGEEGVGLLLSDSTNSEVNGTVPSEQVVAETFKRLFAQAKGRIIVTMFGSHLHRVQHAMQLAAKTGRKVTLAGRALERNVTLARTLGFLEVPDDLLVPAEDLAAIPDHQVLILCTGAQAEPRSALMQMLSPEAPQLSIQPGDTVILSSRTIPGNEPMVTGMLDRLLARGAHVFYSGIEPNIHVSGHAAKDEQRRMVETVRPRAFTPIHGELHHLHKHLANAREFGLPEGVLHLATDGDVLGLDAAGITTLGRVPVGQLPTRRDAEGWVPPQSLTERRILSEGGMVVVVVVLQAGTHRLLWGPNVSGQGLANDEQAFLPIASEHARQSLLEISPQLLGDDALLRDTLTQSIRRTFKQLSGRRPPVLPLVVKL